MTADPPPEVGEDRLIDAPDVNARSPSRPPRPASIVVAAGGVGCPPCPAMAVRQGVVSFSLFAPSPPTSMGVAAYSNIVPFGPLVPPMSP